MWADKVRLLRYPGGKQRILHALMQYLPSSRSIDRRYVEPFAGGAAVFFALSPKRALLSDTNEELIDLYRGIRRHPLDVWKIFKKLPATKKAYYEIRGWRLKELSLAQRAARSLYLNRTCFKGMWRHNSKGEFNVGYGGQDRRWVISKEGLVHTSKRLSRVCLRCSDFEHIIDACEEGDFVFVDPPYRPAERDMIHDHYRYGKFTFDDHKRLAATLKRASKRGVRWAMTTSAHPEILHLSRQSDITRIARGTGKRIGELKKGSGEVLIRNYEEVDQ